MHSAVAHGPPRRALGKPRCEVADIFRRHGEAFRRRHRLPRSHLKVMRAVEACRTAALGGHLEQCDRCGFERPAYNSCRNRHCPKCQALTKARWLQRRRAELLPVPYFHNVFTLPHELNPLVLTNRKLLLTLLYQAVSETLQAFAADPRHRLGGRIGFTAVLHTWDQKLNAHFHLHCLIPAGVLAFDSSRWIPARTGFLFPVRALSRTFRGKYMDGLKQAQAQGRLRFPGGASVLGTPDGFARLVRTLWKKEWIVYSRPPFGGPEKTLDYLGRYPHRVAISNHRLVRIEDGHVTFRYRDRDDGDRVRAITLPADEFIRRFLLHVLPGAFVRIRHFGFLANRRKRHDLARCRELLGLDPAVPAVPEKTSRELMLEVVGVDVAACPCCRAGRLRVVADLPRLARGLSGKSCRPPPGIDSS